jgi:hypothetical protein
VRLALLALLAALPAAAGTVVTPYGAVIHGDVRVEGEEVVVINGKKERRDPKTDFLLVEGDGGRLLYAPHFEARLRGCEYIARGASVALAVKLVEDALFARDSTQARRLLDLAESGGFTGKEAEGLKRRVEDLARKNPTLDAKKAAEVAARIPGIAAVYPDLLVERARADETDGLRLLREALRVDPAHGGALALLAERAPKDFPLGPPALWLDWRLDLEAQGARLLPETDRDLLDARRTWRKDVYGVESGQLRILTPVTDTATVGRCLAYGRVACAALADVFRTAAPKERLSKTLLILLYPNMEEYLKHSTGSPERRKHLATTAGHHSPDEQVSRVVWDKHPDAERRTARVFVHELTHHWVADLNPRYSNAELRLINTTAPWLVEGLATFFEEGIYDPESGTWSLFDARASSLDTVLAVAKARKLLPWTDVYTMDMRQFNALPRQPESAFPVVCRWHLGAMMVTQGNLFYDQSAATVHFLYHGEGGAYRERLLDCVTARYTGKKIPIEAAFGMTPAELGKKVEAYAESVAKGYRP